MSKIVGKDEKCGELLYWDYIYTHEQGYKLAKKYEQMGVYNIKSNLINYNCYLLKGEKVETYDLVFNLDENNCVENIRWKLEELINSQW